MRKLALLLVIIFPINSSFAKQVAKMPDKNLKLFSRPLILGASISRGFGTTDGGPGSVISKLINPEAKVTNKSMSGHTSVESTRNLNYFENDPTIVLAFDLFFWDANREQTGPEFEKNTRKIFETFRDKKMPMIVGRVPVGVDFPAGIKEAGKKKSTLKVNKLLEELCTLENNCILYDPKICFDMMGGPIGPDGVRYFSDSLHTTDQGNLFCANIFLKSRVFEKLSLKP